MENAKHIGGIGALAVALGIAMAVANAPAVALAAPDDSGRSSSSDGASSSGAPSAKTVESAPNDPARHDPRPRKPRGAVNSSEGPDTSTTTGTSASAAMTDVTPSTSASLTGATTTPATEDASGRDARRSGRITSRPASGNTSKTTSPKPLAVDAPTFDAPTARSVAAAPVAAVTAATTSSSAAPAVPAPAPAAWTLLAAARREFEPTRTPSTVNPPAGQTTNGLVVDPVGSTSAVASNPSDPDFISSTRDFFGLFSITSAGDPSDNNYVAVVFETPFFTNVLTSGTDPEDNLGFGAASIGVAGQTVNTFISPFLTFSIAIPIEDPFAALFIELIRLGIV